MGAGFELGHRQAAGGACVINDFRQIFCSLFLARSDLFLRGHAAVTTLIFIRRWWGQSIAV